MKTHRIWDDFPLEIQLFDKREEKVRTWEFRTSLGGFRVEYRKQPGFSFHFLEFFSSALGGDLPFSRLSCDSRSVPSNGEVMGLLKEAIGHLGDSLDGAGFEMNGDIGEILFMGLRYVSGDTDPEMLKLLRIRLGNEAERRLSRMPIPSGDALPKPHVLSKSEARSAISAIRRSNDEAAVIAARNLMLTIESGKPLEE